jgi:hyperosmotically inducible protein
MKKKLAGSLLMAAFVVPVLGHAEDGDKDRTAPRAFVKDSVITTKVKAKLAREHVASAAHIRVDTDNKGVVTLTGTARSDEEATKAVEVARNVEGVAMVDNKIRVNPDR